MKNNIFKKWPDWLRYVCAFPISMLAYLIFLVIMKVNYLLIADSNSPIMSFWEYIYTYILGIAILLSVLYYVIPKHKSTFILVVTSCICTLGLSALYGICFKEDSTFWDKAGIIF